MPKDSGLTLKNVVNLASVGYQNKRNSIAFVSRYTDTQKYASHSSMETLYLKRKEYLVFSARSEGKNERPMEVYFSHPNMYDIAEAFKRAASWVNEHFDTVYSEDGVDGMYVVEPYNNAQIRIDSEHGSHISIQPTVIEIDGVDYAGVAIFVGDADHCCNVTADRFRNFAYYIQQFNLGNQSMQSINFAIAHEGLNPKFNGGSSNKASAKPKRVIRTKTNTESGEPS